jgi:hypothetical protein
MARHQDLTINHRIESWVYANAAARLSATGFVTEDIGRIAYQTDTGQYFRLTGTAPTWSANTAAAPTKVIWLTTVGAGTYTPSSGCRAFYIEMVGGGGGSAGALGSATPTSASSGGGGGGGYCAKYYATVAASYSYVIGGGGSAGAATPTAGGDGGDTTFDGGTVVAVKGQGSAIPSAGTILGLSGAGGPGGGTTGGDVSILGSPGAMGLRYATNGALGGYGGASIFAGSSAAAASVNFAGQPGFPYGGGAAGAASSSATGRAGGAGAQGAIKITEYF